MSVREHGQQPLLRIPWYRGYQFRTLVLLFLLLAPVIIGLHVFTYFSSYTGLVQGMVRRSEVLLETSLYSLENLLRIQTNQIRLVVVESQFRRDLADVTQAYETSPVDFERLRIRLLSSLVATLGTAREAPLWVQEVALIDDEGIVWVSTQPEQEQKRLSHALMLHIREAEENKPVYLLWGEEPALGYDWAWMGLVYPAVDQQGNPWWVLGIITPEALTSWLRTLLALEALPVLRTVNGQAFGYSLEGERLTLDIADLALEPEIPEVQSWNAFVLSMWRREPARFRSDPEEQTELMPQAPVFRLIYRPDEGGWLWLLFLYEKLGPNVVLGVAFPLQETLYPLTTAISRFMQIQAGIFLAVIMVIGWWLSRQVTRPVLDIARYVQAFAEGRWEVRIPVRGQDEVALLGRVLNHMAASLERLYRSLEEEVNRRTEQVRLLLEWLAYEPPRSAATFRNLLQEMLTRVQATFPEGVEPVVVLWHPGRHEVLWRVSVAEEDDGTRPANERMWVSTALQQQQPLLYTQETHRDQLPARYDAVWVQPFPAHSPVAGALVLYSTRGQVFDDELFQQQLADLVPAVAGAVSFAYHLWLRQALHLHIQTTFDLLRTIAEEPELGTSFQVITRLLAEHYPKALLLVRVPETENLWQPLYPADLSARTLQVTFLFPREQVWWMEHDLNSTRAMQRIPRAVREVLQQLGFQGVVVLPVRTRERLEAVLLLGFQQPGEWPDEALDALAMMLAILGQALERADVQEQVRLWELTMNFLAQSAEAPTLGQALLHLVRTLRQQWSPEGDLFFVFVDAEGNFQHTFVFLEGQEQYHFVLSPLEQELVRRIVKEREPLNFGQPEEMLRLARTPAGEGEQVVPRSWMGLPLRMGERVLGVWGWRDMARSNRFDRVELYRLMTLTERLAPVFHYLLRMQHYEQRLQREEWIHALSTHLVALWDPVTLTEETASELMRIFQAYRVTFRLELEDVARMPEPTAPTQPSASEDGGT